MQTAPMLDTRGFGRTGHLSTRIIFGAAALGGGRQDVADKILRQVVAVGINHIDTAASYGDSELRLAPFLRDHRSTVFLATKTGQRTGTGARAELERSLTRLGVDSVDLIQFHNLVEDDEWETVHGRGGALDAMLAARDEGLVRFIGVTGHGTRIPGMHRRSLERFEYDSVLFPYNYALLRSETYRADVDNLIEMCTDRSVAMQTIKSVARGRWTDNDSPHFSWYEPLSDAGAIERAVRFPLSRPGLFVNTSSDARLLPGIVAAASGLNASTAPTTAELDDDAARFGITALFDGAELERI
jgi:aryl-alcohol dehydrogenase-like predicted oxidoreductase